MTREELRDRIRTIVKSIYQDRTDLDMPVAEYDEITKFPKLKQALTDLLTPEFDMFIDAIDYVAPKPTTFRINLKNGENFMLVYDPRSFIAKIEGKKYYILNLNELELACIALARLLSYGESLSPEEAEAAETAAAETTADEFDTEEPAEEPAEETPEEL